MFDNIVSDASWTRLKSAYPQRAIVLKDQVGCVSDDSALLLEAAKRVWELSQVYLVWMDGDDDDFPKDPKIAKGIRDLATTRPKCAVDVEASKWLELLAHKMSNFEITLAIWCATDVITPKYSPSQRSNVSSQAKENIDDLIARRDHHN